ncbi:siphovirus ReqiPepy6 Gp37-like family protein [Tepidibacter hydrothermalis]|uniref:Siphovirus ReqiPepy6 Gp37-like family protein n=1 Tax=Tepidibacter hydrothermalis TaxID=3036126 RepID=A0ABY8EGE9_9FIRM|nr:siphovirus ReqiPepy6 Gp37-like family protein [Tepidibacter hydrothermalis]WFD12020.1 siphovirus ReqiPepy6 Gp37-like family protein [Tepidibacter hydrothermalis]
MNQNLILRIIDPEFNLLGEINHEYFFIHEKFNSCGKFELRINRHKKYVEHLQEGNIVFLNEEDAGIIEHREISVDESGKASEDWLIKGYTLKGILRNRVIIPPTDQDYDEITADAETVLKHYIEKNIVVPTDPLRKIDNFVLAENRRRGINITWKSSHKNLAEELKKISLYTNLGLCMKLDFINKQFVFDILEGKNLTQKQQVNDPVLFSIDFANIKSQNYVESSLDHKNVAYIGGQGEGAQRQIETVGNSTGLKRKEIFIDARDINTGLQERGLQKLHEYQKVKTFEGEILNTGPFKYKKDWDLGDIVTLQNKDWGITIDSRITEIKKTYSENGLDIDVNFGNKIPTILDKIKREIRN